MIRFAYLFLTKLHIIKPIYTKGREKTLSWMHVAVAAPFAYALLVPSLLRLVRRAHTGWFVLPVPAALFAYWLSQLKVVREEGAIERSLPWIPSMDIHLTFYLDGLGMLFALLISGIGSLVVLYSIFYLSKTKEALHRFYVYLLLFMGAMLGVVLSDNLIALYGFWELTSLSSFLLIAYWHRRERSMYGALKSMLITVFGGFAMLAGFVLLYLMTGTFSVRAIVAGAAALPEHGLFLPAMALVLLGAFTKSAQFPFHIWLPDAMEAPTPVSAYLHSATMVKAGIYLVARLTPAFGGTAEWFWLVSGFGLATLFWASFNAVKQTDLKGLLAFSTVSQLGLVMSLLGVGSAALRFGPGESSELYVLAITAAVFHLINHATFKGALFMVAGIVDHETGTRDLRKLGGLAAIMPVSFTLALVGAFSMAGLPPFNGFLSKEMFFTGMLNAAKLGAFDMETWGLLFPVVAWLASVFTFVYSMVFVFRTFAGAYKPSELPKKPHEAPIGLLLPPAALATLVVVFGLFPDIAAYYLIEPALVSVLPTLLEPGDAFHVHISFWHGWSTELFMTLGVVALGALLYGQLRRWQGVYGRLPRGWTLNAAYDRLLEGLERGSRRLTSAYMNGSLRSYLLYIFVFLIALAAYAFASSGPIDWTFDAPAPISIYEALLIAATLFSAIAVPFARSRLTMIILVGAVGYLVVLFFVLFRAPDLALTQMIVETVSVALFLLCFYHLPELKRESTRARPRLANLAVSILVGAVATAAALAAGGSRLYESIAGYYVEESYPLGGGYNVVNVILVDFRGFDTLLEILVLGVASLGIYALIKLRPGAAKKGGGKP